MKATYNKLEESDGQMLLRIGSKFVIVIMVILLFDFFLDIMMSAFDLITHLLHLVMEVLELGIDTLLEYLFNINHQMTDLIWVNTLLFCLLLGVYIFLANLPKITRKFCRRSKASWLIHKRKEKARWRALPFGRKIKVSIAYFTGVNCVMFLLTL